MKKIAESFGNIRYRHKVFMAMLAVAIVPLIACGVIIYYNSREFVQENLIQTKEAQLTQVEQDMEGRLQIYEHITDYLLSLQSLQDVLALKPTQLYELYRGYRDVVDPLLETNMYYHPVIRRMTIYLKDIDLEHGMTIAPLSRLESQEWYRESFADGDTYEKWIVCAQENRVYYVRPVFQYLQMKAVLVTSFAYEMLLSGLETIPTYDEERVYLLSSDGEIVYSNDMEALGTAFLAEETAGAVVLEQELSEVGWRIISVIPPGILDDTLKKSVSGVLVILAFSVAYAIVVSAILAEVLVFRTIKLKNIVSHIGEGNLQPGMEKLDQYNGPMDEIGALIDSTRKMVHRLEELKITVYKEKIARRDLEMKALQAQINPHFLYNSLSIINWKALDAGADEVSGITLKLAEFYRTTLNRGSSMISVEGEIRNIRSYLDIQLIMHDDNFRVEWEVDDAVMNWQMPKLVLQPLVENALEHGLDLKEEDDRLLYLYVGRMEENLVLIVRDNGVGMSQEKVDSLIHYDSKGYGVKNVNERISLLYEKEHVFRIVSSLGEGTEIYIRIPGERGGN